MAERAGRPASRRLRDEKIDSLPEAKKSMPWRRIDPGSGLMYVYLHNHPLLGGEASGWVTEARALFYRKKGIGPHPCDTCGQLFELVYGMKAAIIHMNKISGDDRLKNLALRCSTCRDGIRKEQKNAARSALDESSRY